MGKKSAFIAALLLAVYAVDALAADPKPVYKWVSANEYYFLLPTSQDLALSGAGTESVKPWGFGFRAVGHETFAKTGGLQFQSVKVDSPSTGRNTFYLWELPARHGVHGTQSPGQAVALHRLGPGRPRPF